LGDCLLWVGSYIENYTSSQYKMVTVSKVRVV
jgi:hypothetical protein